MYRSRRNSLTFLATLRITWLFQHLRRHNRVNQEFCSACKFRVSRVPFFPVKIFFSRYKIILSHAKSTESKTFAHNESDYFMEIMCKALKVPGSSRSNNPINPNRESEFYSKIFYSKRILLIQGHKLALQIAGGFFLRIGNVRGSLLKSRRRFEYIFHRCGAKFASFDVNKARISSHCLVFTQPNSCHDVFDLNPKSYIYLASY